MLLGVPCACTPVLATVLIGFHWGVMWQYVQPAVSCRDSYAVTDACLASFGVGVNASSTCWHPWLILDFWPTTLDCAARIADLHAIDRNYTQQVRALRPAARSL